VVSLNVPASSPETDRRTRDRTPPSERRAGRPSAGRRSGAGWCARPSAGSDVARAGHLVQASRPCGRAARAPRGRADDAHGDRRGDRRAVDELLHEDARARVGRRARAARRASAASRVSKPSAHEELGVVRRVVARRSGCSRSAGCRVRGSRTRTFDLGHLLEPPSTKRRRDRSRGEARAVRCLDLHQNCGVSAFGNRLEPISGTSATTAAWSRRSATSDGGARARQAVVQRRAVVAVDHAHHVLQQVAVLRRVSSGLRMRLARNGMMNSAISSEPTMVATTAVAARG
jgi:hypothetical protein